MHCFLTTFIYAYLDSLTYLFSNLQDHAGTTSFPVKICLPGGQYLTISAGPGTCLRPAHRAIHREAIYQ